MKTFKIEVVSSSAFLDKIVAALNTAGAQGYTVLEIQQGKGASSGEFLSSGIIAVYQRILLFTLCDENQLQRILEEVVPIIEVSGGTIVYYEVTRLH
jgi:nitrogen regulatory protein PII